jgi:hypothetical protein
LNTNEALAQLLSTNPDSLSLYEQDWLTQLPTIPPSVKTLAVRSCRRMVDAGKALPDGIEIINFYGASALATLPARLPSTLKSLMLNYCVGLTSLPALPASLRKLDLDDATNIVAVDGLPEGLEELSLNRCRSLKRIGKLPSTLTALCIRECAQLEELPELPPHLKTLFLTNSGLKALPKLPDTVQILDINGVEHLLSGKSTPKYLQSMIAFGGWLHRG